MGGAPPHTDTLIRSAACVQGQIGLFKTTRQHAVRSLKNSFLCSWTLLLRPARKVGLEAGPLDARLENQPSEEVQDRAKAVTSRNQQRNNAFISTQTQHQPRDSNTAPRWRHATAKRASRVFPEQRMETQVRNQTKVPRATRGNPSAKPDKGSQSNAWKPKCETRQRFPEQRVETHVGNETKATACLNQQKASITN